MFSSQYISYALIAIGIFTAYFGLVVLLKKDRNKERTQKLLSEYSDQPVAQQETMSGFAASLEQFFVMLGVNLNAERETISQLATAGFTSKTSLVYFLFFKRFIQPIVLIIGLGILVKLFIITKAPVGQHLALFISALLLTVIGGFGGSLFISNSKEKRQKIIVKTFPEALDLLLICVESGLGIDAALGRVCKETRESHPIIAAEFERTRFEMNVMSDRVQALENLAARTGIPAVRTLVSSLIQAERFGTSLVDTLRMIADEQRNERMLQAETKAARLPALVTIPLIFFIMPALFMVILGPVIVTVSAKGGIFPH